MRIGIIGATGNIGQRILAEALSRGHQVTAFTRDASGFPKDKGDVLWRTIDVFDTESLIAGIHGLDLLVSTYQPGNAARDLKDTLEQSIRNPETYVTAAKALPHHVQRRFTVGY